MVLPERTSNTPSATKGTMFMIAITRRVIVSAIVMLTLSFVHSFHAQTAEPAAPQPETAIDHDLFEVTIPQLEQFYRDHKYTVTEVVNWYIGRIRKYNGIYGAIENLAVNGSLVTAAREDAEAEAGGSGFTRGPMWGVPIVIKENTSMQ